MKSYFLHLSHRAKNIHRSKLYQCHTQWGKGFLLLPLLKVCESSLFRQSKKNMWYTLVRLSLPCISRGKKTK